MDRIKLPIFATVKSYPLSLTYQTIRLCIFAYVIIYGIGLRKRYQKTEIGYGTLLTKVMGTVDTRNRTDLGPEKVYRRLWESTDLVQSFQENGALFITTNAIITPKQQQGECAEDPYISAARCTPKNAPNCVRGSILNHGNGVMTGECVSTQFANSTPTYTCEVSGWCPTERMVIREKALFPDVKDFFILIKAFVRFPVFDTNFQNMPHNLDDTELFYECQKEEKYDEKADDRCPIFRLSYMLKESGMLEKFDSITAVKGGMLGVTVKWDCNFDHWRDNTCQPEYIFRQLDKTNAVPTASWDFRDGRTYHENGVLTRDLHKVFGIFVIFNTEAKAGKFNSVDTLLELSAAFNLFKIATFVCIYLITHVPLLKIKNKGNHSVNSDMSSATPQDANSGSAVSAIDPKQPMTRQYLNELQHTDNNPSAELDTNSLIKASNRVKMQENNCSKEDDASLKLIVLWLKHYSIKIKSWTKDKAETSKKNYILFVVAASFLIIALVVLLIIKKSNIITTSLAAIVVWICVSLAFVGAFICMVHAVRRYLLRKHYNSFFQWLSDLPYCNTAVIILISILILEFLTIQAFFMQYEESPTAVSFLKDMLAAIIIDITCGLILKYTFFLFKTLKHYYSSEREQTTAQIDAIKEFVEHMHDLKNRVILPQEEEPAMYVNKQRRAEPDGAVNNSSKSNEALD